MDGHEKPKPTPRCAICNKPVVVEFKPFCSPRCADIDLGRWLNGTYAIPGGTVDSDEDGDDARPTPEGAESGDNS
jgi:uncharacterized protein